jgi:hypothetical protein
LLVPGISRRQRSSSRISISPCLNLTGLPATV